MPELVAVVYPNEADADKVREDIFAMAKDYLLEVSDAVVAVKTGDGNVKLHQMLNTTAAGAAGGSFWGLLIGFIFMNPLLGVAAGTAGGALAGRLTDVGINDDFMKRLADEVASGEAVLFLLVNRMTSDKVLSRLKGTGGRVLQTSLDTEAENKLRAALAEHQAAPSEEPA